MVLLNQIKTLANILYLLQFLKTLSLRTFCIGVCDSKDVPRSY